MVPAPPGAHVRLAAAQAGALHLAEVEELARGYV
jgi:hypothetical protein